MIKAKVFFCLILTAFTSYGTLISSVRELAKTFYSDQPTQAVFDVVATVTRAYTPSYYDPSMYVMTVMDQSDTIAFPLFIDNNANLQFKPGNVIRAKGVVRSPASNPNALRADVATLVAEGTPPQPVTVTTKDINNGMYLNRFVLLKGTLTEVFRDDIDPGYTYLIVTDETGSAYAHFRDGSDGQLEDLQQKIGATVSLSCFCFHHFHNGGRKHLGFELNLQQSADVNVIQPPPNPYNAPMLHSRSDLYNPVVVGNLGKRRILGRVLATWQGDSALVRSTNGEVSTLHFHNDNLPLVGQHIEAVGTPETDLYQLNLSCAAWRCTPRFPVDEFPIETVSASFMLVDTNGSRKVKTLYSGRTIRISGLVRALPAAGNGDFRLNLLCDEYEVPVDFSSVPQALDKIESGCVIEATGVCVIESENWRPQTPFPHAKGFSVILRTADDVRVIRRPPWWTPKRLAVVIGLLLLAVVGFGIRNRVLRRIAELRVKDRTRLAVELHDALSQTLTGVALELQTTSVLANANSPAAIEHLSIASKTLFSCRQELRNCLQDLRSSALDLPNMSEAIRLTLEPHVADAKVSVRFNVPRKALSDNAAHAVLSIVRELTLNAIRHGRATAVRIAGVIDGDQLLFSVRDNGSGFDPDDRPGVRQGHFGLQGVLERVRALGGSLEIASKPGRGARVAGTMAALS